MDNRKPIENTLTLDGTEYEIKKLMGFGSNSFVYKAEYRDNLQNNKVHTVLIKELFPYHAGGLITRGENGCILIETEGLDLYELHKESFLRGNAAHLDFANVRADMASVNINSYEANGTVYTVIGDSNGETLESAAKRGEVTGSLADVIKCLIGVLDALDVFHQHGLLHLDISPDNILLMPAESGRSGHRVMLIDYNSVWDTTDKENYEAVSFSVKENYSAPEVRLQDSNAVSTASDLFSVCAIFFEYLRGEPLDFAALYSGAKVPFEELPLLSGIPDDVSSKALSIIKKGLRLSPGRRYQSVLELKVDLIELLSNLTRRKRKRNLFLAAIGIVLTVFLTIGTIKVLDYTSNNYPRTQQEMYAVENTATALAQSLGRLGKRIENDLQVLELYNTGSANNSDEYGELNSTLRRKEPYSDEYVRTLLGSRSPLPVAVVHELLNAPETYSDWSDDMLNNLRCIFSEDSAYPTSDIQVIVNLYTEYIDYYTAICYTKLQLVVAPLNTDGKKPILNALPYIPVLGEKFMKQTLISDKNELDSALNTACTRLDEITVRLKSYGL